MKHLSLLLLPLLAAQICAAQTNKPAATAWPAGKPFAPTELPGKGLAEHDFFYAGEAQVEQMFIVRNGKIVWDFTHPANGEISDAVLETNGNILFAHQHGVTEISADKKVVWDYQAPTNTEIHTAMPYGSNSFWFVQNGDPAKFVMRNKTTGGVEHEFILPVKNPKSIHGHFRHARMTDAGTLLIAHMDLGKAAEYDLTGRELWSLDVPGIWSATPLKNGNVLVVSNQKFVREVNRAKETLWEWTPADAPDYKFSNLQLALRLPNGNTIINDWFNQWNGKVNATNAPVQAIEVTPDKKSSGPCTRGRRPRTSAPPQPSRFSINIERHGRARAARPRVQNQTAHGRAVRVHIARKFCRNSG